MALAATETAPFSGGGSVGAGAASGAVVPRASVDRFAGHAAYGSVERQVALGPRPAGSAASRELAGRIRRALPRGRFQAVPGGLRNVIGTVPGRERGRTVVVAAHYDTRDLPGFVGANDGASGIAVLTQLARAIRPRWLRPTVVLVALDGEEAPRGAPEGQFERYGLRGSKVAAPGLKRAEAMILIDFVGERGLRLPREELSQVGLWRRLRAAARRVGVARVFPPSEQGAVLDDHLPFIRAGVPSIDLIDFDYACFHRLCDDLSQISERSLDAVGESLVELLRRL